MPYSTRLAVGLPGQTGDPSLTVDPNRNAQRFVLAIFLKAKKFAIYNTQEADKHRLLLALCFTF